MSIGRFVARHRRLLTNAALALALAVASLLGGANDFLTGPTEKLTLAYGSTTAWHRAVLAWWLLATLCFAGLLIQHHWPLAAVILSASGATGHLLNPRLGLYPLDLAAAITLFTLTTRTRRQWFAWVAAGAMAVAAYLATVAGQIQTDTLFPAYPGGPRVTVREDLRNAMSAAAGKDIMAPVLVLVIAVALGTASRNRRAHLAVLEQRAADMERERNHRTALAVAAERTRITRELHDAVAHGLSVIVVQAQGAAASQDRHPERTAVALQDIIATGRASLAEMRRLLGIARADDVDDAELNPQPGIGALPALVDQVRAAGTIVGFDVAGEPVPLPAGVDLSAYRIVQESLTNTLKHAGPGATAAIRLGFTPQHLEIEVSDDGVGASNARAAEHGTGLRGIAERVGILGGELVAGPCPGRGFRVRAVLPITAEPAELTT